MEEFFLKYIVGNLHRKKALIAGIVVALFIFSAINGFLADMASNTLRFIIYSISILLWVGYWCYNKYYISKISQGKVGVVIAICADNEIEQNRLRSDFVEKLISNINIDNLSDVTQIVCLNNHISETIKTSDDVVKINKRIDARFYLYGTVRKRDNGKKYIIDLKGVVFHKAVDLKTKNIIAKEFVKSLPPRITFEESVQFEGFEYSADLAYLSLKYIVGIAALVSGDLSLAHRLHYNLRNEFNKYKPLPQNLQEIRNTAMLYVSDEELLLSRYSYYVDKNYKEAKTWIEKSLLANPNNYGAWTLKSIYDFSIDSNPQEALKSIEKAERYSKNTYEYLYSKAFLCFWENIYDDALKVCNKIRDVDYKNEDLTIKEVLKFNTDLLNIHPSKIQLYFWLGFITYIKQKDNKKAKEYFDIFVERSDDKMILLRERVKIYLGEINKGVNSSVEV